MSEIASKITLQDCLKAGVHFGHATRNWHPETKSFVHSVRQRIHIIDLRKSLAALERAQQVLRQVSERGGRILFVGTKRIAAQAIEQTALSCNQSYVNKRWLGGTLTNWKTVRRSIRKLKDLQKKKATGYFDLLTKKEALILERNLFKLEEKLGGIQSMNGLPDLLFIIDIQKERTALLEAEKAGIPTIAIVDTNVSPRGVTYPIPGNDDSSGAVSLYLKAATSSILEGIEARKKHMSQPESTAPQEEASAKTLMNEAGEAPSEVEAKREG